MYTEQIRHAETHRRPRSPAAARRGATLQAKQHLPHVPGEPSTNIRVHLCVFYLRFWACVRRICRVPPLHASIGEVHNLNTQLRQINSKEA